MPPSQMTLRLPPDAAAALAAAHAAVGGAIPLHRLAVLALARGAREIAAAPTLLFAAPAPPPAAPPTAHARVRRDASPVAASKARRVAPQKAAKVSRATSAAGRVGAAARWGGVPVEAAPQFARDLAAALDGDGAMSTRALAEAAGVSAKPVANWRKAYAAGEPGGMSLDTYTKLRAYLDKHPAKKGQR